MSVLAIFEDLFNPNVIKLTKIPREYYSQGLGLIKASRRLHSSDEDIRCLNSEQLTELRRITDHIGVFLKATTTNNNSKAPENRDREIDDLLMAAVEAIDQYQTRYQISPKWANGETDFRRWICAVKEEDGKAAKHMEVIQAVVDKKVVSDSSVLVWRLTAKSDQQKRRFSGMVPKKVEINRWPEQQLTVTVNSKSAVIVKAKHRVYNIEGSASLDDVLLRLRMQKALSMSCNPQFYKCFPLRRQDLHKYGEERSQKWKIFPFESWMTINEALKALKDVKMDALQLVFDNAKYREQNSPIRNIWDIEEGQQVFKGIFGALELYEAPPFPQPDHSNSSSLATRSVSDAYPQNGYPPNQHFWPQPGATQNQYIPPSRAMPAIARLPHEEPSQSNISTTSTFSDESRSLSPAPPPTMASSPSVNVMQRDSTPTPPVPEVKRGWTLRGAFGADKKKGPETKRMEHKAIPLGPNQQESQVAAPSSSSAFLRPAMAEPRVRKRDRFMQIFDYKATEG